MMGFEHARERLGLKADSTTTTARERHLAHLGSGTKACLKLEQTFMDELKVQAVSPIFRICTPCHLRRIFGHLPRIRPRSTFSLGPGETRRRAQLQLHWKQWLESRQNLWEVPQRRQQRTTNASTAQ